MSSNGPAPSLLRRLAKTTKRKAIAAAVGIDRPREPFADFYGRISPEYLYPEHLAELVDALERIANGETIELVVTCPPRHSKTETVLHGIAWLLMQRPSIEIVYGSYGASLAEEKSRIVRGYCERAGVDFAGDANQVSRWKTRQGGGFLAGGVGGGQTGFGGDLIIIDDPYKGFVDANSAAFRRQVDDWFSGTLYTRRSPGASTIIIQTRWHPEDLAGKRERAGWRVLRRPAIDDEGRALWPERYDAEELAKIRGEVGPIVWSALYQGQPPTKTGALFADVVPFSELPLGCAFYVGVDLAYSSKSTADYSVAVVVAKAGSGSTARLYVVDMLREQTQVTSFAPKLKALMSSYGVSSAYWYASGTEQATAQLMGQLGVGVITKVPRADKKTRALPSSAIWHQGRVLVNTQRPWSDAFVREVTTFTGDGDDHDDIVDALVAAVDAATLYQTGSVTTGEGQNETRALGPRTAGARKLKW